MGNSNTTTESVLQPSRSHVPTDDETKDEDLRQINWKTATSLSELVIIPPNQKSQDSFATNWRIQKFVGSGTYGYVYACQSKTTSNTALWDKAVKVFKKAAANIDVPGEVGQFVNTNSTDGTKKRVPPFVSKFGHKDRMQGVQSLRREVKMMHDITSAAANSPVGHEFVLQLVEACETKEMVFLVIERLDGDLFKTMAQWQGPTKQANARWLMQRLLKGVYFLHDNDLAHLDIKPDNIATRLNREPVLFDFGFTQHLPGTSTFRGTHGTSWYMSPESAGKQGVAKPADIFALGVSFYGIATGLVAFNGRPTKSKGLPTRQPQEFTDLSDNFQDLVRWMLQKDPNSRPTAEQCLSHNFFDVKLTPLGQPNFTAAPAFSAGNLEDDGYEFGTASESDSGSESESESESGRDSDSDRRPRRRRRRRKLRLRPRKANVHRGEAYLDHGVDPDHPVFQEHVHLRHQRARLAHKLKMIKRALGDAESVLADL